MGGERWDVCGGAVDAGAEDAQGGRQKEEAEEEVEEAVGREKGQCGGWGVGEETAAGGCWAEAEDEEVAEQWAEVGARACVVVGGDECFSVFWF